MSNNDPRVTKWTHPETGEQYENGEVERIQGRVEEKAVQEKAVQEVQRRVAPPALEPLPWEVPAADADPLEGLVA